ncbi:MAG: Mu transposase C-terminal domain-containing protein [Bacteroidetes bacterium]|nr:Mu transposase C-terminal domain-containing protein [Bacteroidota bacterium]
MLDKQSGFLTYEELSYITGWSLANIKVKVFRKELETITYVKSGRGGNGGKRPLVHISDPKIPIEAREKYFKSHPDLVPKKAKSDIEADMNRYIKTPNFNRAGIDKYKPVLIASEGYHGRELDQFLKKWNAEHPGKKPINLKTLYKKRAAFEKYGNEALYYEHGKKKGQTKIQEDVYDFFARLWLTGGQPSAKQCHTKAFGYWLLMHKPENQEDFPSESSFLRLIDKRVSQSAQCLAREGYEVWRRKYPLFIDRNYEDMRAGEVWVGDHRQLDVLVVLDEKGVTWVTDNEGKKTKIHDLQIYTPKNSEIKTKMKPFRPWLTAWIDMRSQKMMSCFLHEEAPNADHVFLSFAWGVKEHGLPDYLYMDNGREYKCNDFAGQPQKKKFIQVIEKEDEVKATTLLSMINVHPVFAIPKNSQAKVIEQYFRGTIQTFEKFLKGYTGKNHSTRPDETKKIASKSPENLLPFSQFETLLMQTISQIDDTVRASGKLAGKTPNQVWAENFSQKRMVSEDSMRFLYMRTTKPVTVQRNGVEDGLTGAFYYNEEFMAGMKRDEKVYLRRDPRNWRIAYVFDAETDTFICESSLFNAAPGMAKDEIGRKDIGDYQKAKARELKEVRSEIPKERVDPEDLVRFHQAAIDARKPVYAEANPNVIYQQTEFDRISSDVRKHKKTGTDDIGALIKEPPVKQKLYGSPEEKADYERMMERKRNRE